MSEQLPPPAIFMVDGFAIDLHDVSTVICGIDSWSHTRVCRVILKSGVSFNVDIQYSSSLIKAVKWSRSPGRVVNPEDGILDRGEFVYGLLIVN